MVRSLLASWYHAVLVIACVGVGCGAPPEPGAALYGTYCQGCHLPSGEGIAGIYPPLVGTDWVAGDEARLIRLTLSGVTGPMEVNGVTYDHTKAPHSFLTDSELAALLTHVRARYAEAGPISPDQVARIRAARETDGLWNAGVLERTVGFPSPSAPSDTAAAADGAEVGRSADPRFAAGVRVYQRVCQACHQADGGGVAGLYPPILADGWVSGSQARLVRLVLRGMMGAHEVDGVVYQGVMPPHAFLDDSEVAAVLTYVRAEFGDAASPVSPDLVARIRTATEGDPMATPETLDAVTDAP